VVAFDAPPDGRSPRSDPRHGGRVSALRTGLAISVVVNDDRCSCPTRQRRAIGPSAHLDGLERRKPRPERWQPPDERLRLTGGLAYVLNTARPNRRLLARLARAARGLAAVLRHPRPGAESFPGRSWEGCVVTGANDSISNLRDRDRGLTPPPEPATSCLFRRDAVRVDFAGGLAVVTRRPSAGTARRRPRPIFFLVRRVRLDPVRASVANTRRGLLPRSPATTLRLLDPTSATARSRATGIDDDARSSYSIRSRPSTTWDEGLA